MNTTSNPFTARIQTAAQQGYLPTRHRFAPEARRQDSAITERQIEFASTLLTERDLTSEDRPKFAARLRAIASSWDTELAKMTKDQASALIEYLLTLPVKKSMTTVDADIPAGHYAIELNGDLMFVKVDRPIEGRWAGYTFVTRQSGDDYLRITRALSDQVISKILADTPKEAAIRYGHELGRCAICHRSLTNEESRESGIGPVCRAKNGW